MPEQKDVCETPSKYLPLYFNYLNQFALLTDEQVGRLIRALLLHGRDGADPDFDKNSSIYMAYSFILDNSERAQGRQQAARRLGGINRAANAQKDEKGRFLPKATSNHPENIQLSPAEVQLNPAKSSKTSKTSYNNNKDKDKNKDKNKDKENIMYNHRRRTVVDGYTAHDDCDDLSEREKEILDYCRDVVGAMTKSQKQDILSASNGMQVDSVLDAITIAYEEGARTPDYIIKTINSQRENPHRRPRFA